MEILIDPHAGFCPGVRRAIELAERTLAAGKELTAVGAMIHNQREVDRLAEKGLQTISQEEVERMNPGGLQKGRLMIRTHGVGEQLWNKLQRSGAEVLDGTCGIVRRVQKLAQTHHQRGDQVVIIGKKRHAEVSGIVGHTENRAIVVETEQDIAQLDPRRRTVVMAQTTVGIEHFRQLAALIRDRVAQVEVIDTTCKYIGRRHDQVIAFAKSVEAVIFVGGKESSNSQILFELCRQVNPLSCKIERPEELDLSWVAGISRLGITGGASTPPWQFEQLKKRIEDWMSAQKPQEMKTISSLRSK